MTIQRLYRSTDTSSSRIGVERSKGDSVMVSDTVTHITQKNVRCHCSAIVRCVNTALSFERTNGGLWCRMVGIVKRT